MILLNADKISLNFTEKILLNEISLTISQGDKIGVVGINGTGKSTLLRILSGELTAEKGTVTVSRNISVSYLSQNPQFNEELSALEYVLKGFDNSKFPKEHEAMAILNKLGVEQVNIPMAQLSGGQKRRVAIAKALIFPCEILILDEPTNHIDNDAAIFLEEYLQRYKGAIIMVTHDRYFLDRVSNRIIEIEGGSLFTYNTNYEGFLELAAQREEMAISSERKRQSILRTELEWLKRGARARGTKSKSRIENIERIKDNAYSVKGDRVDMSSISSRLGRQIIEIENISKSYEGKKYIDNFSYNLLRGDRIGIIGPNGCGKSTLLKIIIGEIPPDSGSVKIGQTVKIGYFSQDYEKMDTDRRLIDYIRDYGEHIQTKDGLMTVSKLLETFLFPSNTHYTPISKLSGGERRRLYLLTILIKAPNIIFFDEPTNDFDITTLSILENFIDSFDGAVIAVSHDRYFLDRIATKVFAFENGMINEYLGGYTDYSQQKKVFSASISKVKIGKTAHVRENKTNKAKFSFNEQREYNEIDGVIAEIEGKISKAESEIAINLSDYTKLQSLTDEKHRLENQLAEKMEQWVYLNDIAEKIEEEKA